MEFKELVAHRRSVRKYADRPVPREAIAPLLDAALTAPSSRNTRSTHFMVVTDRALIDRMASMRDYGASFLTGAPAVVLVMGDRQASDLWVENAAIAATLLQLAAEDAGLRSCWVHVNGRPRLKAQPEGEQAVDYLRSFLPLPLQYGVLCAIALGYSDHAPKPLPESDDRGRVVWL